MNNKRNANINGLSCTWQAPNRTTAGRISLLCEIWETSSMAENSFHWCWPARCTKKSFQKWLQAANCLLSLTRCQGIPASVPSSISWMNAKYEATTVGRGMLLSAIIHQSLENTETFSSTPRPRPRFFLQDQYQDQDFYFKTKTKTKTIFHVLEALRDKDQGLETSSLLNSLMCH